MLEETQEQATKYVRWYAGSSNSPTWIHIDSGEPVKKVPRRFGWWKKTLCGRLYELDSYHVVKDEEEIANRLCRRCAQQKRKAQRAPDVNLGYEIKAE